MGLAPYGDASVYRDFVNSYIRLLPDGDYEIEVKALERAIEERVPRRRPNEDFSLAHKNLAAAIQEGFERILLHVLGHFQRTTGHRNLAIAGGCGQNSTFNGVLDRQGSFDRVFVMPAATDAGNAIGAAVHALRARGSECHEPSADAPFWGPELPDADDLQEQLAAWSSVVDVRRSDDIIGDAAQVLAQGAAIGWVQGRTEFGPRALGARSILADPRPAENKDIVNAMVKKREAYRPFAPAVQAERLSEFFDTRGRLCSLQFMTGTVPVWPEHRETLGAVTHVDGSARVQSVERDANPRFWQQLGKFGELTGVPVLLNTSFNNNVEPIVNTAAEAVQCLLTCGLQYLVVGDYFISKREEGRPPSLLELAPILDDDTVLTKQRTHSRFSGEIVYSVSNEKFACPLPRSLFDVLHGADGSRTLGALFSATGVSEGGPEHIRIALDVICDLWELRLLRLEPPYVRAVHDTTEVETDDAVEKTA